MSGFRAGDKVIYRKQKVSTRPGPRARNVRPSRGGEHYSYLVDKFWLVTGVREDGAVVVRTRRGKEHVLAPGDPRLQVAPWWKRVWYRDRFPDAPSGAVSGLQGRA